MEPAAAPTQLNLVATVKQIASSALTSYADGHGKAGRAGPMVWKAIRVAHATNPMVNEMNRVMVRNGASQHMMQDFVGWAKADPTVHGKRMVFIAEDCASAPISKEAALPADTPFEAEGLTAGQLQAWWRTNQQCDLVCTTIMAVLQSYMIAKQHELVVVAEDGPYVLVDVERAACSAAMGFNGLIWTAKDISTRPAGVRSFVDPERLGNDKATNHTILKMHLRKPDGSHTHIWCDPTVRQITPELPLQEDGLHDVKFMRESTMRGNDKYADIFIREINDMLDHMDDPRDKDSMTGVPWCLPRIINNFQQQADKGYMPQRDVDIDIAQWKRCMDRLTQVPVDWEQVAEQVETFHAFEQGSGMMTRDPVTGKWKPFVFGR